MRTTHPLEASIGMELYSTSTPGVGGRLKVRFEDFIVEEITTDRRIVSVQEWSDKTPRLKIPEEKSQKNSHYRSFNLLFRRHKFL